MAAGDRTKRMIGRVRSLVGEPSEQGFLDSEILLFLNEAQLDLCLQVNDAALYALQEIAHSPLTLDNEPYELPSNFMRERVLVYKRVMAIRWDVFRLDALDSTGNVYHQPTESDPPPHWYLWDNKLYIEAGTKTAGNYHLYYYKLPTTMSVKVDPSLPMEFDGLMVLFGVMRIREKQGHIAESERLWNEYLERCEIINSRYTGREPFDGVPGDRRAS